LVGKDLAGMGHNVTSVNGSAVGGFQSILVTPAAPKAETSAQPVHGFYRSGSDHRKDGQAVGW
jgi:gamma-glutamyltranspeptidase/glutathione hydrolase